MAYARVSKETLFQMMTHCISVCTGALETLEKEVVPEVYSALDSSAKYRKSLVLGLFYKVCLLLLTKANRAIAYLQMINNAVF